MQNKYILLVTLVLGFAAGFPAGYAFKKTPSAAAASVPATQAAAPAAAVSAVVKAQKIAPPPARTPAQQKYQKKDTYFAVPAVNGGKIDLADYAGKPVMFMLFTETCPFCRKAGPALERLHKAYGDRLAVLGLCIQDEPQAATNFAADLGITFPMGYGAREVFRQYRAQGVPFIFLLDSGHEVASVWPGYAPEFDGKMKAAIDKALAKK